jgi:ATP-dependent phosphoenolpyruvate carboxykinase
VTTLVGGTGRIEATPDASIENVECHTCPVFSVNIPVALARVDDSSPDSRQPYIEP